MNRYQLEQMAAFQPPAREKSKWWYWLIILGGGALIGWLLIHAGNTPNPGSPVKVGQSRVIG